LAFLVSYSLAALGPVTMGAVRDATGGYSAIWGVLCVVMLPQIVLAWRLRPGLAQVT
jgi:CP family cyanate transporter-like MFS transporter